MIFGPSGPGEAPGPGLGVQGPYRPDVAGVFGGVLHIHCSGKTLIEIHLVTTSPIDQVGISGGSPIADISFNPGKER